MTRSLCSQCSATEPQHLDNNQPSQSSVHEQSSMHATGGTEVPQSHTRQPLSMCHQNSVRGQPEINLEVCECWWLSGHCSSVAEHWLHKPGVLGSSLRLQNLGVLHKPGVLGLIPGDYQPFHFLYYRLKNI